METRELKYPMNFKQCPNCGSTDCVLELETNKAIAEGKLKKKGAKRIPVLVTKSIIFDPDTMSRVLGISKKVRAILGLYDVCANCGTLYCVSMQEGEAVVEPREVDRSPNDNMRPFFGRG